MKYLFLILIYLGTIYNQDETIRSNSACSITTVNIPTGSNIPVMIYSAKTGHEVLRFTVLDKEHIGNLRVDDNHFYTDPKTGEQWYVDKDIEQIENLRDIFSPCRMLNTDNKKTRMYDNKIYSKYRVSELPSNISTRQTDMTSSFLQTYDIIGQEAYDLLESLDKNIPDTLESKYESLNNDALEVESELENGMKEDTHNNYSSYTMLE